ncbi:MAG: hypothetical protein H0W61_12540 [Bacteroidetes bacterium]|nr:hypothetical protein [Bacteroidota bacterium]
MKKTNLSSVLLIAVSLFVACKKKNSTSETASPSTPAAPAHVNSYTAVVNGQAWTMPPSAYSTFHFGNTYSFQGQTSFNNPFTTMGLSVTFTTGTVALTKYGPFSASYGNQSTNYKSLAGSLNISSMDTAGGYITKLKGTFNFQTDTVNGQSYSITSGNIDYIKP